MALPFAHLLTAPATTQTPSWIPDSVVCHPAVIDLLRPLDPAEFFAQWWEQAPVHAPLPQGRRGALVTTDDLDGLIRVCAPGERDFHLQSATPGRDGLVVLEEAPTAPDGRYDAEALYKRFQEGRTIVARRLDSRWRPVTRLCRGLESALRCPVTADLHHVPRGSAGLGPRAEPFELFIMQLQGRHTWTLHEPETGQVGSIASSETLREAPRLGPGVGGVVGGAWGEVTLGEGDLLYVPSGWCHRPSPPAGSSSTYLALAVQPLRWADLLVRVVEFAAARDPRLQQAVPLGDSDLPDIGDALRDTLPKFIHSLLDPSKHHGVVQALAPGFLAQMEPPPEGRADTSLDLDAIGADTPVIRRLGLPCSVREEGMVATIHFPGGDTAFPRRLRPALEFIASSGRFTARQMPPTIAPDAALFLVCRLCREGLLAVAV